MKTAIYSVHKFERDYLLQANNSRHELILLEETLTVSTVKLAAGCQAICIFVSDKITAAVLDKLYDAGISCIALRSAGYNHVDIAAAKKQRIRLARVPQYSPYSVAEHATALMLALNRQIIHAHNRINEQNFSLDGLTGFDMHGKTVGIIGTGKIGSQLASIMHGFGCNIVAYDTVQNKQITTAYDMSYLDLKTLCHQADIISLHLPLNNETNHIICQESMGWMKKGVMIINTSRGGLIHTGDIIVALKSGHVGYFGMDVYEEEEGLFFEDHSLDILQDDVFARLSTFRNVIITSHQAFLTETSLKNIAATTVYNLDCFEQGTLSGNELNM
ncbi:MAG TPA: 2-hydroxyacid dehydrogenase [Flavipsychrobacter sp.]|nr:2-hydroxyacid dehydrogenase [Flavipsychrobacter sp.]